FFSALGVPLIAGRDFDDNDRRDGESVVIVSQSLAQRLFPNQDALNRHLTWTDPIMKFIDISPKPRRIVGIVAVLDDQNVCLVPCSTSITRSSRKPVEGGCSFTPDPIRMRS